MIKNKQVSDTIYSEYRSIDREQKMIELRLGSEIAIAESEGKSFDEAVNTAIETVAAKAELHRTRKILFFEKLKKDYGLTGEGNYFISENRILVALPGEDEWLPRLECVNV